MTLVILGCALPQYGNYWPLTMALFYMFAPIPTLMARKYQSDGLGSSNTFKEISLFITAGIVISTFALPVVLCRAPVGDEVIKVGAAILTLFANLITFLNMLGFFIAFDSEDEGYSNWS